MKIQKVEEKTCEFSKRREKFSFGKQNRYFGKPRGERRGKIKGKEKNVRKISGDHGSGAAAEGEF
ncbi:MAG: hypothetical protein ACI4WY_07805 [Anaerovoracaceae bacterium]